MQPEGLLFLHDSSGRVRCSGWLHAYDVSTFLKGTDLADETGHDSLKNPHEHVFWLFADNGSDDACKTAQLWMNTEDGGFASYPEHG